MTSFNELTIRWGNREVLRDEWLSALRAETYPKGKNCLQRDGRFCVLGVLCEVAGIEAQHEIMPERLARLSRGGNLVMYDGSSHALPRHLALFMNMETCGEFRKPIEVAISLVPRRMLLDVGSISSVNDMTDLSFPQIADVIERHWDQLMTYGEANK